MKVQRTFTVEGHIVNIFTSRAHLVSVTATQLCHCSRRAATHQQMSTTLLLCFNKTTLFTKAGDELHWCTGHQSLLTLALDLSTSGFFLVILVSDWVESKAFLGHSMESLSAPFLDCIALFYFLTYMHLYLKLSKLFICLFTYGTCPFSIPPSSQFLEQRLEQGGGRCPGNIFYTHE